MFVTTAKQCRIKCVKLNDQLSSFFGINLSRHNRVIICCRVWCAGESRACGMADLVGCLLVGQRAERRLDLSGLGVKGVDRSIR